MLKDDEQLQEEQNLEELLGGSKSKIFQEAIKRRKVSLMSLVSPHNVKINTNLLSETDITLPVIGVQNVKVPKFQNLKEKEGKCPKTEEISFKLNDVCLADEGDKLGLISSQQNGVLDEDVEVCSAVESEKTFFKPVDMEVEGPDLDKSFSNSKPVEDIKKNLSWIRWTDYTPYAKNLIKANKWELIQNEIVTVVTYNVLSQNLLEKHRHLYKRHDPKSLQWDERSKVLLDEFSSFNADILCLQEVDSYMVNSFYNYNLNEMGYEGIYKQRTNDKMDGCAIYFKKNKFNLVTYSTVELYKESIRLLDRDNIGVILKLSLQSNPEIEFIVATTHLLYNPRRGDIKLVQTQLMLAEIEKLAYKKHNPLVGQSEYLPIIFTGDMNYPPNNGVYQLVTKSFLEYEGMSSEKILPSNKGYLLNKTLLPPEVGVTDSCQYASSVSNREHQKQVSFSTGALDHHLNLESVYNHIKGNLPEATTNQGIWVTVDYIFYSQLWDDNLKIRTEGDLKLLSKLMLPNSEEAEVYLRYIPNTACGSDHLPLVATFHLTKSK